MESQILFTPPSAQSTLHSMKREADNRKELNRSTVQNAVYRLVKELRLNENETVSSVSTIDAQIHTASATLPISISEVVMTPAAAQANIENQLALRMKQADAAIRISIHSRADTPIAADVTLQPGELAFRQLYISVYPSSHSAVVESYIEVAHDYSGIDLQGNGLGSALLPQERFNIDVTAAVPIIKQLFPELKTAVFVIIDNSHGKGNVNRSGWTTQKATKAGYTPNGRKLVKTVSLQ